MIRPCAPVTLADVKSNRHKSCGKLWVAEKMRNESGVDMLLEFAFAPETRLQAGCGCSLRVAWHSRIFPPLVCWRRNAVEQGNDDF